MDPVIHIELVDRDNQVISTGALPASAFPVTMRLVSPNESAASPSLQTGWRQWILTPIGTLTALVGTALIFGLHTYAYTPADPAAAIFSTITFCILALLVWPSLWTMFGRYVRRPHTLRKQQLWTCALILGGIVLWHLESWLNFLWPDNTVVFVFGSTMYGAFVLLMVYGHLTIRGRTQSPRRWYIAGTVAAIFTVGVGLVGGVLKQQFDTNLRYEETIKPLDARFIPATQPESFSNDLLQIEADLKKELQQELQTQ